MTDQVFLVGQFAGEGLAAAGLVALQKRFVGHLDVLVHLVNAQTSPRRKAATAERALKRFGSVG